jgi:two-component system NarL family sensor kinase
MKLGFSVILLVCAACSSSFGQSGSTDARLLDLQAFAFTDGDAMRKLGDSLLGVGKASNDKALQASVYLEYGNHHYYFSDYHGADSLYQKVESLTTTPATSRLHNKARLRRGVIFSDTSDALQARKHMHALTKEFVGERDNYNLVYAYNSIANTYIDLYQRDSSMYYFMQALTLCEQEDMQYERAFTLNNLALFKLDDNAYDDAYKDLQQGLEYADLAVAARLKSTIIANLGLVCLRRKEYLEARSYFNLLLQIAHKTHSYKMQIHSHTNLAASYLAQKLMPEAKAHYDSVLYVCVTANERQHLPQIYLGLGTWYLRSDSFERAIEYADLVVELSEKREVLAQQVEGHHLASKAYDSLALYEQALARLNLVRTLSDSMEESTNQALLSEFQSKYQLSEKEAQLALVNKQHELDRVNLQILIFGGSALVIAIFILLYFRYLRIARKQKAQFAQNLINSVEAERGRIARDLHDDVGQTLSMIKNKVNASQIEASQHEELDVALQRVIEQTREISRTLYPSYLKKVGLTNALSTLVNGVEQRSKLTSTAEIDEVDEDLDDEQKTHLYRIVQECINNTMKHANATALKVSLIKNGTEFQLTYQDNGIGLSSKKGATGLGMMSIAERVEILKGDVSISSNRGKGIRIFIKFNKTITT